MRPQLYIDNTSSTTHPGSNVSMLCLGHACPITDKHGGHRESSLSQGWQPAPAGEATHLRPTAAAAQGKMPRRGKGKTLGGRRGGGGAGGREGIKVEQGKEAGEESLRAEHLERAAERETKAEKSHPQPGTTRGTLVPQPPPTLHLRSPEPRTCLLSPSPPRSPLLPTWAASQSPLHNVRKQNIQF